MALKDLSPQILSFFQQMADVVHANLQEDGAITPTIMIQYTDADGKQAVQWQPLDTRDEKTILQSVQLARAFASAQHAESVAFFCECAALDITEEDRDSWVAAGNNLADHPDVTVVMAAQLEVAGEYFTAASEITRDEAGIAEFALLLLEECERERIAGFVVDILPENQGLKYIYGAKAADVERLDPPARFPSNT